MPRLKIELPETFPFSTEMQVPIGDINYGNHLGNDAILRYAQEARLRFLAPYGWSELNCAGCALIMASAEIVYKAQGYHGETVRIEVAVTELRRTGFDLAYRIHRPSDQTDIAHIRTGMAFFDYEAGRPCKTPPAFIQTFASET
jgi:acyl-CoA thioesterase FadM